MAAVYFSILVHLCHSRFWVLGHIFPFMTASTTIFPWNGSTLISSIAFAHCISFICKLFLHFWCKCNLPISIKHINHNATLNTKLQDYSEKTSTWLPFKAVLNYFSIQRENRSPTPVTVPWKRDFREARRPEPITIPSKIW